MGCEHKIKHIKIPTLFMYALDDPIVPKSAIDYEAIANNENTVLATHDIGGHCGYN
jgi:predicted alpha/beta-fold hydrolase